MKEITDMEREVIISELKNNQYLSSIDAQSGRYREIPEYQIISFIFSHESVSTEEIEQNHPDLPSIPLLLSNLQNDGLISQSPNNYKWEISDALLAKIEKMMQRVLPSQEVETVDKDAAIQEVRRRELNQLAQILEKKGVPIDWTRGNLLNIPEVEVVYKLWKAGELSTDRLEQVIVSTDSISLVLSNLQADRLIEQTSNYNWKLNTELLDEFSNKISVLPEMSEPSPPSETEPMVEPANLSHLASLSDVAKLLKVLKEHPSFRHQPEQTLIHDDSFKILQIIMENQPISTEQILQTIGDDVPISLLLSNLAADGLVRADESSYNWHLNEDLSIKLRKISLEKDDLERVKELLQSKMNRPSSSVSPSDDPVMMDEARDPEIVVSAKEESSPEMLGDHSSQIDSTPTEMSADDEDVSPVGDSASDSPSATIEDVEPPADEPIEKKLGKALEELGHSLPPESGEFHILLQLLQHGSLSGDQIEHLVEVPVSVSLSLSNLVADGLVVEESYMYELSPKLTAFLATPPAEEISPEPEPETPPESEPVKTVDEEELAFQNALKKLGYIRDGEPLEENINYSIIKTIKDHPLIDQQGIKQRNPSISPVLVTRTLTQLEIDGVIEQKTEDSWQLTQKISSILNEDERKVKEMAEEERRRKERIEREQKFSENRERLKKIYRSLISDGLLPPNESFHPENLMQYPPYEILVNMNLFGLYSINELKGKVMSASPVIISRTIIQLLERGYLIEESQDTFSLTEKGKGER
ncbi:MAG: hypothetical protein D6732_12860 [Methanobacteriota archaeon]|nr:MAG: hypothetical protein D6732_12860 [Euryarchaeota archaeon]